jgi:YHS domain-containing protein
VRGVKGSKVLRTRKVKYWSGSGIYNYFCSQGCYNEFANKYIQEVIAIAPRTECLETPILDPTKEHHSNSWHSWTNTKIEVDETRQS